MSISDTETLVDIPEQQIFFEDRHSQSEKCWNQYPDITERIKALAEQLYPYQKLIATVALDWRDEGTKCEHFKAKLAAKHEDGELETLVRTEHLKLYSTRAAMEDLEKCLVRKQSMREEEMEDEIKEEEAELERQEEANLEREAERRELERKHGRSLIGDLKSKMRKVGVGRP